jgi:hypothetical protein
MGAAQLTSVLQETQTWDEAGHLTAGYVYLKTGHVAFFTDHPPLRAIFAVPLLFMNLQLPLDRPEWKENDQPAFATQFLYTNRYHPDRLLLAGRGVAIALTLAFGAILAWWTERRFGARAALLALALFAFEPNLIAHGRYVTTDMLFAFTFFLASIAWCEFLWYRLGPFYRVWVPGVALGLAFAAKFSALALLPVYLVVGLAAWRQGRIGLRTLAQAMAATLGVSLLVVAIAYAPETIRWMTLQQPNHPFVTGIGQVLRKSHDGHESYLLGEISQTGWWYYFPVVVAVKTPVSLLALLAIGVAGFVWRPSSLYKLPLAWFAMAVPAALFFGISMVNAVNIGVRHILPIYPIFCVLAAILVLRLPWGTAIGALGVGILILESVLIYPNYLGFFNLVAGGPQAGPRYLLDSNLDWGQDVKKLRTWLQARGVNQVCMEYFGNTGVEFYGIPMRRLPQTWETAERDKLNCVAAISVTNLYGLYVPRGSYAWLQQREPDARIGWSIYVYDLRKL